MNRFYASFPLWLLVIASAASAAERLPNGIELPTPWPPQTGHWSGEPMPVPYLQKRPAVINVDVGRQLFVDDFLIASSNLKRTFHAPQYHPQSPVLRPEKSWENDKEGGHAAPYSDGVWYDPGRKKFVMWYQGADRRTCLALSDDGIQWTRPELDIEPGTNTVLTWQNKTSQRDSNTVWLDYNAPPHERFKLFEARYARSPYRFAYRTSPDGIHWSEEQAVSGLSWDRTTAFYNPFRDVWVASVRGHDSVRPAPPHRLRCYFEAQTAAGALAWKHPTDEVAKGNQLPGDLQPWVGADRLDPHHPDPRFSDIQPQLYNLDVFPYESLMVGLFTIWQGPTNEACSELGIPKRNEVLVGFSRDGFHWDRTNRARFLSVNDDPQAWNAGNVQSAGGGCLVVGDQLYFYCSGRTMQPRSLISTGLATMRRDGFASMDAVNKEGQLTTRPIQFTGRYLFVNAKLNAGDVGGELRAEILDSAGNIVPGFDRQRCTPFRGDSTAARLEWPGVDLASIVDKPVAIRFTFSHGSLWSFWITSDPQGASQGYLAAGSPNHLGARDVPEK